MTLRKLSCIAVIGALCLALSGILVGCSSPSPSSALDTYLKEQKSTSTSEIMSEFDDDTFALFGTEFADTLVQKMIDFDYKIGSEEINGDTAVVQVTITTYNLGNAFTNFFQTYMSQVMMMAFEGATEDEIMAKGVEIFKEEVDKAPKDYESTVPVNLTKVDGAWVVDDGDEDNIALLNAVMGGMIDSIEKLEQDYSALLQ